MILPGPVPLHCGRRQRAIIGEALPADGAKAAAGARVPPGWAGTSHLETAPSAPTYAGRGRSRAAAPAVQIHTPDPDYLAATDSPARFRAAALLAALFVAGIALVHVVDHLLGLGLARFGVVPRELAGLRGVLAAPLLHADLGHLVSNVVPLLVGGTLLLYLYPDSSRFVLPAVYVGSGLAVWIAARGSTHIGASGLVYGIVAYIFVAGILRRDRRAWAASILVAFLYGAMVWGVLPLKTGVSWETHLAAALIGIVLAFVLRLRDVPPRKRYSWEDEDANTDVGEDLATALNPPVGPVAPARSAPLPAPPTARADSA